MPKITHILAVQQDQSMGKTYTAGQRAQAWAVHLFTASGIITVFMALVEGTQHNFKQAMWWLLAAQVIDGVDGTLARYFKVTEVLPQMSGKSIDFVIDFAAYAIVPAFLIYQAEIIASPYDLWVAFLILVTAAIYYGKDGMISEDYYFVGFPVMWNMAAFYLLFVFEWAGAVNLSVIIMLATLQFVPVKFAYPSRTKRWRAGNLTATVLFVVSMVGLLWYEPREVPLFWWGCVLPLIYFGGFAFLATFWPERSR
ncbi:MAG: CDP-alcohol phosphatidyltransferase family protein [Phaeodactylibacter sp.]|uniref:CDP-alcohol phosphatidyltransferase family protein n=1 Tax=Phaeodactylibacter sp. TaxID=1940289 RepID=UPI0032EA9800